MVTARGERDDAPKTWFLPARPMDEARLEALWEALAEADAAASTGRREQAVRAGGRVHHPFLGAHPFRGAQQSVALMVVNDVLGRAEAGTIPHLALDHFALRLTEAAYEALFARAVARYGGPEESPAARLASLAHRTAAALAFMDAVSSAPNEAAADAVVEQSREAAALALLVEPR